MHQEGGMDLLPTPLATDWRAPGKKYPGRRRPSGAYQQRDLPSVIEELMSDGQDWHLQDKDPLCVLHGVDREGKPEADCQ
jgi:hypothetical protein